MPNGRFAQSRRGKHVLCEKPIAVTAAEARAMFAAAERCGVHLVEGYPYRAQSQTLKLKELVDSGALGRLQLIQASMGFTMISETNIRSSPSLGGGALMDVGVYPVRAGPAHWTGASAAESIDIMLTVEALLQSARSGKPVRIDQ